MEFLGGAAMRRVIKNEDEYEAALAAIEDLMDRNPAPGTPDSDDLDLLVLLVQDYESREHKLLPPDPIEAIRFRMEQQDLSPRDLIPYIGSRSKVSEVLARKRPLTLSMMRALHSGLGIPAGVLIQQQEQEEVVEVDWDRFPLRQMIAWGWVEPVGQSGAVRSEDILRPFCAAADLVEPEAVLCRSSAATGHVRSARAMDDYALRAWSARVLNLATVKPPPVEYRPGVLDLQFLRQVARMSVSETGPLEARDLLRKNGVQLIVERHLPGTYLDGAAIMARKVGPVVGLTLRYDRLDNFWFTLMHELAHLSLHMAQESSIYYDDLDMDAEDDPREREADELAGESLVPADEWKRSPASRLRSPEAAEHLARKLQIHPAIVAGYMRHEFKAYRLLNNLVGHRKVRRLFPETNWS